MSTSEAETEQVITLVSLSIRDDPFIKGLLAKLSAPDSETFTEGQLVALKAALGGRSWGAHAIDLRRTFSIWRWRYYLVFLAGRNRRALTRREHKLQHLVFATILVAFGTISTLVGILVFYLATSALSIEQIPGISFGVWDWFKQQFL